MPFDGVTQRIHTTPQLHFDWKKHFHFNKFTLGLDNGKCDGAESLFFQRELEHIIPEMFEFSRAKINGRSLFPIDRSANGAVKNITWRQFTKTGQAEIVANYADDVQIVNAFGEEFTSRVQGIRVAAKWDLMEIRAAMMENRPLERFDAMAAREAMLRRENDVIFAGDAAFGLVGLASAGTGIPQNPAPNGDWLNGATTAAEILQDLSFAANTIPETTGDVEEPTRLLMPTRHYNRISELAADTGTDTTVLTYFLRNNQYIREIVPIRELDNTVALPGPFGTPVMVAYNPEPSKIRYQLPLDIEQFAPESTNQVTTVTWHMRIGGLTIHKPASLNIVTGIGN